MTTPQPAPAPDARAAAVRELLGLALLVLGTVGLGVVTYLLHPLLCAGGVSGGLALAGYNLVTADTATAEG